MFKIIAWDNGVGYNVECDTVFAETLRDALDRALKSKNHKGNAIGDIFEIDVEITEE